MNFEAPQEKNYQNRISKENLTLNQIKQEQFSQINSKSKILINIW